MEKTSINQGYDSSKTGWTSVEWCIVLAIFALIASTAIPFFLNRGKTHKELRQALLTKLEADPSSVRTFVDERASRRDTCIILFRKKDQVEANVEHVAIFDKADLVWLDGKKVEPSEFASK